MDIKKVLQRLIELEDPQARQTGRTTSIVKAAKETKSPYIVVHNDNMKEHIKRYMDKDVSTISLNELDSLHGINKPAIFIDNAALFVICAEALNKIESLEKN